MASPEQTAEIDAFFRKFDADGSDSIDDAELGQLLRSLGQSPSEARIRALIAQYDENANGVIDRDEFHELMREVLAQQDDPFAELVGALEAFNRGDGTVSLSQLRLVLTEMGEAMEPGEVDETLRAALPAPADSTEEAADKVGIAELARALCGALDGASTLVDAPAQTAAERLAAFWDGRMGPYRGRVALRAAVRDVGASDAVLRANSSGLGAPVGDAAALPEMRVLAAHLLRLAPVDGVSEDSLAQGLLAVAQTHEHQDSLSSASGSAVERYAVPASQITDMHRCAVLCDIAYEASEDEIEDEMERMEGFELVFGTVLSQPRQPAFMVALDVQGRQAVVCVRGSPSLARTLAYTVQPAERSQELGGMVHGDVLAMAAFVREQLGDSLDALPGRGYTVTFTGHSLGGSVAGVLALLMRAQLPGARAFLFGALPCVDHELAAAARDVCTAVAMADDLLARADPARVAGLMAAVGERTWPSDDMSAVAAAWRGADARPLVARRMHGNRGAVSVPTSVAPLVAPGNVVVVGAPGSGAAGAGSRAVELVDGAAPPPCRVVGAAFAAHRPGEYVLGLSG